MKIAQMIIQDKEFIFHYIPKIEKTDTELSIHILNKCIYLMEHGFSRADVNIDLKSVSVIYITYENKIIGVTMWHYYSKYVAQGSIIFIEEPYRKLGLYTELRNQTVKILKEKNITCFMAFVSKKNLIGVLSHKKYGYVFDQEHKDEDFYKILYYI